MCELCGKSYFAACELSRHRRNKHNIWASRNKLAAHNMTETVTTQASQKDNEHYEEGLETPSTNPFLFLTPDIEATQNMYM